MENQFERLIGITKRALHKAIRRTSLIVSKLEKVLLDVEINLNRRPLFYVEDDLQYPISTHNSKLLGKKTGALEEYPDEDGKGNWKNRQKYDARGKGPAWKR